MNQKKQLKKIIKRIKKHDNYDKELETYTEAVLVDPFVYSFSFLRDELDRVVGFAGFTENEKIRYIWIFRKYRNNGLAPSFCLKYGVESPTKQIMDCMIKSLDEEFKNDYVEYMGDFWNIKLGFVIKPMNTIFGELVGIIYNKYNYGEGTFRTIETILPTTYDKIDLIKLDGLMEDIIKKKSKKTEILLEEVLI